MRRKLTKSNSNVILTGTLAGVAEYFGIDPTIVRLIYVLISIGSFGTLAVLYFLAAMIIPSDKSARTKGYGHDNPYYTNNNAKKGHKPERKQAEKIDDDDWSDF